ncbi:MAG: gamma-glutamyl-gamma-aminobutyrate hydrolase family protein [Ectothiorhodospiraceae bacterium]|nr:gamma-glutamyl-gamma-aminobutyrate hydrolase family protein [Ectothiorhodospiraceae bacterium]
MRPRIGVTGPDRGGLAAWVFCWLAIRRAGGQPVHVTPSRPRDIDTLDGLIIGGGADVDPALYGEPPASPQLRELRRRSPGLPRFLLTLALFPLIWLLRRGLATKQMIRGDPARDALETRLLLQALERDMPILGICRGAQLLSVVCGGSLHQDLSDYYEETPSLWTIWPQKTIHLDGGSRLARLLGKDSCQVNSLHRQAIREPGRGLQVVAWEDNRVIQAVEHAEHPCVFGVQWHPEYLPQRDEQQALFRALVGHAVKAREPLQSGA